MYDREVPVEKLKTLLEALKRIPHRSSGIAEPADFYGIDEDLLGQPLAELPKKPAVFTVE